MVAKHVVPCRPLSSLSANRPKSSQKCCKVSHMVRYAYRRYGVSSTLSSFLLVLAFEQYLFVVIRFHNMYGVCVQFIHGIHFLNVIIFNLFYRDGIPSRFQGFYAGQGLLSLLFLTMQSFSTLKWFRRGRALPLRKSGYTQFPTYHYLLELKIQQNTMFPQERHS